MTKVPILLTAEHHKFIEDAMKSGRYVSESEVVADAIAELKAREQIRHARIDELRNAIAVGIDQLDRGEGLEWSVEEFNAEARGQLQSR